MPLEWHIKGVLDIIFRVSQRCRERVWGGDFSKFGVKKGFDSTHGEAWRPPKKGLFTRLPVILRLKIDKKCDKHQMTETVPSITAQIWSWDSQIADKKSETDINISF